MILYFIKPTITTLRYYVKIEIQSSRDGVQEETYLKHILTTISNEEKDYLKSHLQNTPDRKFEKNKDNINLICELLKYAPEIFLDELKITLKNYKDLTLKFKSKTN
jgi:hypothetical protein